MCDTRKRRKKAKCNHCKQDIAPGFCTQTLLGWRCKNSEAEVESLKEYSWPLTVDNVPDDKLVLITWPDEDSVMFFELSIGNYKLMSQFDKQAARGGEGFMWEGEMMGTHHRLTIAQRKDRALLLSLYEQGKQVCMVRMNILAPIANESEFLEKDHPTSCE